jgi:hypothetical protein
VRVNDVSAWAQRPTIDAPPEAHAVRAGVAVDAEAADGSTVRRDPDERELDESGFREDECQSRVPPPEGAGG